MFGLHRARRPAPRVGLVLGAGGVIGGAWLAGGMSALEEETGWDASRAERIVGTSAGSLMAAALAAGSPPWREPAAGWGSAPALQEQPVEESLAAAEDEDGAAHGGDSAAEGGASAGEEDDPEYAGLRLAPGMPRLGPGSPRLALTALRNRDERAAAALMAGVLPQGLFSLDGVRNLVRGAVPSGWADHEGLWVVACRYSSGEREVFGRAGAPRAELAEAVAASCAVPSFFRPVEIGGHLYVDGGLWSPSNLDLLAGEGMDLVICLNPTSSLESPTAKGIGDRIAARMRSVSGRRLGNEAKELRAAGVDVALIQPTAEDLDVMPPNLMSSQRRHEVYETARRTVAATVRREGLVERLRAASAGGRPGGSTRRARALGAG